MQNEDFIYFEKIQHDDWKAFNFIFEKHQQMLYTYALGFVKQNDVAEDIVQETFISFWTNRDKIKLTSTIYAYLLRSVKNSCIDYKIHKKVEKRYANHVLNKEKEYNELNCDSKEIYNRLQNIISRLPEKCKEVFILACIDELSYNDVAKKLNISVNTVKTQMKTAYKKIKTAINKDNHLVLATIFASLFKF